MRKITEWKVSGNELVYPRNDMKWFIPGFVGWLLFYSFPFVISLISSFMTDDVNARFVWWDNYAVLIRDSYFFVSLKNILLFLCPVMLAAMVLGLLIAQTLFVLPRMRCILVFFLMPLFLPAPSVTVIWNAMVGSGSQLAQLLRMHDEHWKYTSLFLLFLWKNVGAVSALYFTGMRALDKAVLNAAQVDGAKAKTVFFHIELPLLRNVSVFTLLYLLMNGIRIFRECYLLYGAYPPPNLFFIQHYINLCFARLDFGLLSAAGTVFSVLVVCIFAFLWKHMRHGEADME